MSTPPDGFTDETSIMLSLMSPPPNGDAGARSKFPGSVDEMRISTGARYRIDFTPPIIDLPNAAPMWVLFE